MMAINSLVESKERSMTTRPTPKFTGIETYPDRLGRYTIRFPSDWHRFDLDHGRDGVLMAPSATNTATYVAVWVDKLEFQATAEDADDLSEAFDKGLAQLPELFIIASENLVVGNLVKLERFYTFRDNDMIRKRKVWAMYVADWLMVVTYQGESVEEWEHWYAMANQSFFHFVIPPELFYATDRDLNKKGTPVARVPRGKPKN